MYSLPVMRANTFLATIAFFSALFFAACESPGGNSDPCRSETFKDAGSLAIITSPAPGDPVPNGTTIRGCGRAFESSLNYKLTGRDGRTLASGFTQAGGVDGPAPFSFVLNYSVTQDQLGHLEVYEEDASDGEGFPPGRCVIPVRLTP